MKKVKTSLTIPVLLKMGLPMLLTTLVFSVWVYFYLYNSVYIEARESLKRSVSYHAQMKSQRFLQTENNLRFLAELFQSQWQKNKNQPFNSYRFDEFFIRKQDNSIRMKSDYFHGFIDNTGARQENLSAYIRPGVSPTDDIKQLMLLGQKLLSRFAPLWQETSVNVYFFVPDSAIMLYWPGTPWGLTTDSSFRFSDQLWHEEIKSTQAPTNNQFVPVWTGLQYDKPSDLWKFSCVTRFPLDGNRSIAFGSDVIVEDLLNQLQQFSELDSYLFITDSKGQLLVHSDHMARIRQSVSKLYLNKEHPYPSIVNALKSKSSKPRILEHEEDDFLAGIATIKGPGWRLVQILPKQHLREKAFLTAFFVFLAGFSAVLFVWVVLFYILSTNVISPLQQLVQSARQFSTGDFSVEELKGNLVKDRSDEIGRLASVFVSMAESLSSRDQQLRENEQTLILRVEERTSELQQAKKSEEELSRTFVTLLEKSTDFIYFKDKQQRFTAVSQTMANITGHKHWREMLGKTDKEVFSEDAAKNYWQDEQPIISGEKAIIENETPYVNSEGQAGWVDTKKFPICDDKGTIVGLFGISRDISAIKKLNEELAEAKKVAERANQAKSDFLANMSHEIRTPINAITGLTYLTLQTELSVNQRDYITKVHSSVESLSGIINDILDFSKIEAGKLDVEKIEFDLYDVLDDLVNLLALKASEKGIELIIDIEDGLVHHLIGDPLRVKQILINLSNNAIKFTEQGSVTIKVHSMQSEERNGQLLFSVEDTGVGLTEDQIKRLFNPFSQADTSTTRKYGGTGLGLTISKKLTELMGGTIGLDSQYGQGSKFFFTITFDFSDKRPDEQSLPALPDTLNILISGDNQVTMDLMQRYLRAFQVEVLLSHKIDETLSLIKGQRIDILIMDWNKSVVDIAESIRAFKNETYAEKRPEMIIASAFEREPLLALSEQQEIDAFLIKPVTPSTLYNMLTQFFSGHGFFSEKAIFENSHKTDNSFMDSFVGAKILLVEDNEINQQIAKELLCGVGIQVTTAGNGQEALKLLEDEQSEYDGVLMDVQMPVMDGLIATKKIRQQEQFKDLPVLAMTANAMRNDIEQCEIAGMNDHIPKPINVDNLFRTLFKWLKTGKEFENSMSLNSLDKSENSQEIFNNHSLLPEEANQNLETIDVSSGLKRVNRNWSMYQSILSKFIKHQKQTPESIKRLLQSGDNSSAQTIIHTLIGVSGNIGLYSVHGIASEFEDRLRKDLPCDRELTQLFQAMKKACEEIEEKLIATGVSEPVKEYEISNKEIDTKQVQNCFNQLHSLLERNDPGAIDILNDEIIPLLTETKWFHKANELQRAICDYEFEKGLILLESLSSKIIHS